jgi:hypothetical protein
MKDEEINLEEFESSRTLGERVILRCCHTHLNTSVSLTWADYRSVY